jgi:hypothetical protein
MPGWWIVTFGISLVAVFVVAAMPGVVLISSLYTFGILGPFWLLAANLWWLLALIGIWLFVFRMRGVAWATGVLVLCIGLVAGLFYSSQAEQRMQLPAQKTFMASPPVVPAPQSLDYVVEGQTFSEFEVCDALCLGLMRAGGLRWLRLVRFEVVDEARVDLAVGIPCTDNGVRELGGRTCSVPATIARRTVIIERRVLADCRAKVLDHPADAPCLMFAREDGRKAELRLTKSEADYHELGSHRYLLIELRGVSRLKLENMRGENPVLLAQYVTRFWRYTVAPVPFYPVISLLGNGGGLRMPVAFAHDPRVEDVDVLARAGLTVERVEMLGNGFVIPSIYDVPLEPEVQTLAKLRGTEPGAIWSREGPTKRKVYMPRGLTAAEMEVARATLAVNKAKRRAASDKIIVDGLLKMAK